MQARSGLRQHLRTHFQASGPIDVHCVPTDLLVTFLANQGGNRDIQEFQPGVVNANAVAQALAGDSSASGNAFVVLSRDGADADASTIEGVQKFVDAAFRGESDGTPGPQEVPSGTCQ